MSALYVSQKGATVRREGGLRKVLVNRELAFEGFQLHLELIADLFHGTPGNRAL